MGAKSSRLAKKPVVVEARRVAAEFDFPAEHVRQTVQRFVRQMQDGLANDGHIMIPSFVSALPTGTEKGVCLAVDIGGTNCRVCSVELHGNRKFSIKQSKAAIPKDLRIGSTSTELFSFIAMEVESFLKKHYGKQFEAHRARGRDSPLVTDGFGQSDHLPLGFTFSFTFQQTAIDRGIMARWDKGFDIPDTIGKDVVELLQEQIDKLDLPVRVTALANDTVGTLMSRAYTSPEDGSCILGAVFGTGTNGAYVEKMRNVSRVTDRDESMENMIINTEWCSFGDGLSILPTSPYDEELDKTNIHPGETEFEKRVSGMYLGELFRLALLGIFTKFHLRLFKNSQKTDISKESPLFKPYGLDTSVLSTIGGDGTTLLTNTRRCLEKELGVARASLEDAAVAKIVAEAIGRRAARLSGAVIAAIILKSECLNDRPNQAKFLDIGVDGSLIEHYPGFEENIRSAIREVPELGVPVEKRIRIGQAKDGSGVGAALVAMVADKQKAQKARPTNGGTEKISRDLGLEQEKATATSSVLTDSVAIAA